jgi:hypothetical protein
MEAMISCRVLGIFRSAEKRLTDGRANCVSLLTHLSISLVLLQLDIHCLERHLKGLETRGVNQPHALASLRGAEIDIKASVSTSCGLQQSLLPDAQWLREFSQCAETRDDALGGLHELWKGAQAVQILLAGLGERMDAVWLAVHSLDKEYFPSEPQQSSPLIGVRFLNRFPVVPLNP